VLPQVRSTLTSNVVVVGLGERCATSNTHVTPFAHPHTCPRTAHQRETLPLHCTILMPAYNTAPYVGDAIQSALQQTYRDFDVLVVDDGSTDGTDRAVERLMVGKPVSMLRLPHRGLPTALAEGIRYAQGPVLTFVGSDDLLEPHSLECVVPLFGRDPDLGYAWSRWRFYNDHVHTGWSHNLPPGRTLWQAVCLDGWWKASCQQFFSKHWYEKSRGLDVSIPYAVDLQLAVIVAETGCRVFWVDHMTYIYRSSRPGSISSTLGGEQKKCAHRIVAASLERMKGQTCAS